MRERVVVTGMGVITPLGLNLEETWQNLIEGKSGVKKLDSRISSQVSAAATINNFQPENYLPEKELIRVHRSVQFACAAVKEALDDCDLDVDNRALFDVASEAIGIVMGTGIGGGSEIAEMEDMILAHGDRKISQYSMLNLLPERGATVPSKLYELKAHASDKCGACATGGLAIEDGDRILQTENHVKAMVVGGTEAVIHRIGIGGFNAMKALSRKSGDPEKISRPFDKKADGFVMGEGAGALILEKLDNTLRDGFLRGSYISAELIGYGDSSDAFHDTAPSGEGATRAIRIALEKAGIKPEDVDYINTHGTSTLVGDAIELDSLSSVFGKHLKQIAVSSTKSMTGHMLGAAGAVEAIFCIKAIQTGIVPPTINLWRPIRKGLNLVKGKAQRREVNIAMSNSFGFGGINSVLIFKKFTQ